MSKPTKEELLVMITLVVQFMSTKQLFAMIALLQDEVELTEESEEWCREVIEGKR